MGKNKGLFVYYDPKYDPDCTRKFLSESVCRQIMESLTNKGFKVLNAQELKEAMLAVIRREITNVVIVFAQDVAPDTVLDDPSATALLRQYLDNGGSMVWLGDIPFFYQAKKNGQERNNEWWKTGAASSILGVYPIFPGETPIGKISRSGKKRGLSVQWTGIRPVLERKDIDVLVWIKCQVGRAYMPLVSNWFLRKWNKLRSG